MWKFLSDKIRDAEDLKVVISVPLAVCGVLILGVLLLVKVFGPYAEAQRFREERLLIEARVRAAEAGPPAEELEEPKLELEGGVQW